MLPVLGYGWWCVGSWQPAGSDTGKRYVCLPQESWDYFVPTLFLPSVFPRVFKMVRSNATKVE